MFEEFKYSEESVKKTEESVKTTEEVLKTTEEVDNEIKTSLSEEQQIALDKFERNENIFLTGPAGTGKSFLINQMVHIARTKGKRIQITAMTGVAAILLGRRASTLHSFSGIKLAQDEPAITAQKVWNNIKHKNIWKQTDILVIDEVSMMSQHIFDTLVQIFVLMPHPIQLVFVGDMFQLPPVGRNTAETRFCFESVFWSEYFPYENHIELRTIFRQNDPLYIQILNEIREGTTSEETIRILATRIQTPPSDKVLTRFFPKRESVDQINRKAFSQLSGVSYEYPVVPCTKMRFYMDTGVPIVGNKKLTQVEQAREIESLTKNTQTGPLTLRIGAQIMCTANLDINNGIVNGSQGKVIGFIYNPSVKVFDKHVPMALPIVEFVNGTRMTMTHKVWQSANEPSVAITQMPMILCWAMTIHKSQGATLESAEMDIGTDIFEYGQAYVALSRVKTIDGLYLRSFHPQKIRANPVVTAFYTRIRALRK